MKGVVYQYLISPMNYPITLLTWNIDLELEVIEGQLPEDVGGYVFVNSVAGTVNFATPPPAGLARRKPLRRIRCQRNQRRRSALLL